MSNQKNYSDEYVLVFPARLLHELGYFNGASFETGKYLDVILRPENHEYLNRNSAETDPEFKQLIPYMILQHGDTYFSYRRGKLMGEKRLHGNYSIGVGGHISVTDPGLFGTTYEEGMKRELFEEVGIDTPFTERRTALINDDSNDVGRVHFGVVHLLTLERPAVRAREKSVNESRFVTAGHLRESAEHYETWSQICIGALDKF
ncbi:phosphoesterase [candidate division KSB1 bacterium]